MKFKIMMGIYFFHIFHKDFFQIHDIGI